MLKSTSIKTLKIPLLNINLSLSTSRRVFSFGRAILVETSELKTRSPVPRERLMFKQWPSKSRENRLLLFVIAFSHDRCGCFRGHSVLSFWSVEVGCSATILTIVACSVKSVLEYFVDGFRWLRKKTVFTNGFPIPENTKNTCDCQILFSFSSDKDRRTDSQIRRKNTAQLRRQSWKRREFDYEWSRQERVYDYMWLCSWGSVKSCLKGFFWSWCSGRSVRIRNGKPWSIKSHSRRSNFPEDKFLFVRCHFQMYTRNLDTFWSPFKLQKILTKLAWIASKMPITLSPLHGFSWFFSF